MRSPALVALAVTTTLAVVLVTGCQDSVEPGRRQSRDPDTLAIVGLGDSIVYGSNLEKPWLWTLLDRISESPITHVPAWPWDWTFPPPAHRVDYWYESETARVYNMGIDGNTTQQMAERFDSDVVPVNPEYCIILGGVNDILYSVPLSETKENLLSLYRACASNGITPIPATLVPFNGPGDDVRDDIRELNAWIRDTAAANGWYCADFHAALESPAGSGLSPHLADGLHPTQRGHDLMGNSIDIREIGL